MREGKMWIFIDPARRHPSPVREGPASEGHFCRSCGATGGADVMKRIGAPKGWGSGHVRRDRTVRFSCDVSCPALTQTKSPAATRGELGQGGYHMNEIKPKESIAYFSMEIGLESKMPTYSGGLGMLAGDTIRSAADMGIPLVAVTLLHRKGYFTQHLDAAGWQQEEPVERRPEEFLVVLSFASLREIIGAKIP